jgi:hypothetical protein
MNATSTEVAYVLVKPSGWKVGLSALGFLILSDVTHRAHEYAAQRAHRKTKSEAHRAPWLGCCRGVRSALTDDAEAVKDIKKIVGVVPALLSRKAR